MLAYSRFDREPFPGLYDMFAGKKSGPEVLAEMETKGLAKDAGVMFFAHYYIGLNEDLHGHAEKAREHLEKAVALAMAPPVASAAATWVRSPGCTTTRSSAAAEPTLTSLSALVPVPSLAASDPDLRRDPLPSLSTPRLVMAPRPSRSTRSHSAPASAARHCPSSCENVRP